MRDGIAIARAETASLQLLRHVALTVVGVHNCLNAVNGYLLHMNLHTLIRHLGSWRATSQRALRARRRFACGTFVAWRPWPLQCNIAGCASKDGIRVPGPAATVSSDKAFALPPPGGPSIVNVVQHDFNNAAQQDIYLFTSAVTPGQNVMRVTFFGPVGLDYDDRKGLGYSSIRNSDVDRDMRRDLPGVAMAKSDFYVQNNYGPFGYATGRSRSGDTCLYAWQQIRSGDNARTTFTNRGTVQIRLRICDARASEQELLRVMYGYSIAGTFPAQGWNPYDSPPTVDPNTRPYGKSDLSRSPGKPRQPSTGRISGANSGAGGGVAKAGRADTRGTCGTPASRSSNRTTCSPADNACGQQQFQIRRCAGSGLHRHYGRGRGMQIIERESVRFRNSLAPDVSAGIRQRHAGQR